MRQKALIICAVSFFITSLVFGALYFTSMSSGPRMDDTKHPLLAKRLLLENPSDTLINFQPLRKEVKKYLDETGVEYSFYFEYLFTGSSIRYGEDNKLVGASLMKIPIVMDLYKAKEMGKIDLDQTITVRQSDINKDPQFGNQNSLKPGDQITLREAARISLVESDNTASLIVFNATKGILPDEDKAINNLDIETTVSESDQGKYALISARSYTSFLKCLYFSCFVSPDSSQEILDQLSTTDGLDAQRIRSGVPKGITVAQKFGSFSNITQSDCGIVYVPNRRYTLCIMLDENAEDANKHISELSRKVYEYVTSVN